ncbi:MAG TPA: glutaredoxin family protein [Acidobacteriaceae bacterium]|nr:glutaredoxin family protein [Acidobacteriaceae bacterium]
MKQQCHLAMIWLSWAIYAGGAAAALWFHNWFFAGLWILLAPVAQWQYIRRFPAISGTMGYGPVTDAPAPAQEPVVPHQHVTLYTAVGCPFCPLIEQRLERLQAKLDFSLEKIDVTLRPDLLMAHGLRAVPAIEAHGQIRTGLLTSEQLAEFLAPVPAVAAANR